MSYRRTDVRRGKEVLGVPDTGQLQARVHYRHRVGRVFSPVVGIGTPPTPHPHASACLPTLWFREEGRGTVAPSESVSKVYINLEPTIWEVQILRNLYFSLILSAGIEPNTGLFTEFDNHLCVINYLNYSSSFCSNIEQIGLTIRFHSCQEYRAGIFKESMGARNRGGRGLSFRPPPGYIGWRNSFLGIDSGAPYTFKNTGSGVSPLQWRPESDMEASFVNLSSAQRVLHET